MKHLLDDYKRRLKTLNEELKKAIDEASDFNKIILMTVSRYWIRTFISELEKIIPPVKASDLKKIEAEEREQEEMRKRNTEIQDKETADFIKRLLAEPEDDRIPQCFREDFEPSSGK